MTSQTNTTESPNPPSLEDRLKSVITSAIHKQERSQTNTTESSKPPSLEDRLKSVITTAIKKQERPSRDKKKKRPVSDPKPAIKQEKNPVSASKPNVKHEKNSNPSLRSALKKEKYSLSGPELPSREPPNPSLPKPAILDAKNDPNIYEELSLDSRTNLLKLPLETVHNMYEDMIHGSRANYSRAVEMDIFMRWHYGKSWSKLTEVCSREDEDQKNVDGHEEGKGDEKGDVDDMEGEEEEEEVKEEEEGDLLAER